MRPDRSRPLKEELKDLLSVHTGERRAILVLLGCCAVALGWAVYQQWFAPRLVADADALRIAWAGLAPAEGTRSDSVRSGTGRTAGAPQLFAFDPNDLPVEQWVALGLSERQADAIHRFEAKGGRFRTKADVARMRVVDPALFAAWAPYIQLPDSLPVRERATEYRISDSALQRAVERPLPKARSESPRVELNSADSAALVAVPGIGPAFARGIIKYRDKLGGFHSLDQLAEVYILRDKPDAVARLRERLSLDTARVRRFDPNTCTAEELGPHPAAGWKVAKALVAYRKQHGPFRTVGDVKGCALVTDSVYRRLSPYLRIAP